MAGKCQSPFSKSLCLKQVAVFVVVSRRQRSEGNPVGRYRCTGNSKARYRRDKSNKQRREDEAFANTMAILMLLVLIAGSIGAVLYVLYNGGVII